MILKLKVEIIRNIIQFSSRVIGEEGNRVFQSFSFLLSDAEAEHKSSLNFTHNQKEHLIQFF